MNRFIVAIIVLAALIGGGWFIFQSGALPEISSGGITPKILGASTGEASTYVVPSLEGDYKNDEFRFSLDMPEGFSSSELPADENGGRAIIFQDTQGNGIQVYVTPHPADTKVLTADDIRASIPDMEVKDVQEVEIGNDYRGVAFLSDNEAFGGSSREVWFIFHGNLYQISTYARLDNLLRAMFGTWKFF